MFWSNLQLGFSTMWNPLVYARRVFLYLALELREKELLVERLERERRGKGMRGRLHLNSTKYILQYWLTKSHSENLTSIREELVDLQDAHSALSRSTNQTITSQKTQITTLTHQNSLLQNEVAQLRVTAEESGATAEELQSHFNELIAIQEILMWRVSEEGNMSVIREELHTISLQSLFKIGNSTRHSRNLPKYGLSS